MEQQQTPVYTPLTAEERQAIEQEFYNRYKFHKSWVKVIVCNAKLKWQALNHNTKTDNNTLPHQPFCNYKNYIFILYYKKNSIFMQLSG
jgi:hypothetical protein